MHEEHEERREPMGWAGLVQLLTIWLCSVAILAAVGWSIVDILNGPDDEIGAAQVEEAQRMQRERDEAERIDRALQEGRRL